MIHGMEHLETIFDRVEYLQNLLVYKVTGGSGDNLYYQAIRKEILDNPLYSNFIPRWLKVNCNLSQFWQFIRVCANIFLTRDLSNITQKISKCQSYIN
jgi:hypothetical protein